MTTKVTVDAHAGWPVKVTQTTLDQKGNDATTTVATVAPNTTQDFYVHSHMRITVEEMPREQ